MKYRRRPHIVEAMLYENTEESYDKVLKWLGTERVSPRIMGTIKIQTLNGWCMVNRACYIVKGLKDEFYPCEIDIFEMLHDKVPDNGPNTV